MKTAAAGGSMTVRQNGRVRQFRGSFQTRGREGKTLAKEARARERQLSRESSVSQPGSRAGGPDQVPPREKRSRSFTSFRARLSKLPRSFHWEEAIRSDSEGVANPRAAKLAVVAEVPLRCMPMTKTAGASADVDDGVDGVVTGRP
jgi:hypothetical protein